MNSEKKYFFDTYAIIEIAKDNKKYYIYKGIKIITGILNYSEFLYWLFKEKQVKEFVLFLQEMRKTSLQIDFRDVFDAMKFRYKNIKRKLSFVDCVGYAMALRRNLIFLTGDPGFKGLLNVEFVK